MKIDYLNEVATNILNEEIKENNLDTTFYVLTLQEFDKYREIYGYDENEKDSFYDESNNIVYIILDDIYKNKTTDLFNLIMSCYHEIRHVIQTKFAKTTYEGFLNFIDNVNSKNNFDYDISHNGYSFEIGANLYGIGKTKEYMLNNFPSEYELAFEKIKWIEKICKSEYLVFNASSRFNMFIINLKKYMKQGLVRWKEQPKKVDHDLIILDEFSLFLNYDGTLKNINEITSNKNFKKFDKKIIYAIFSSNSFLDSININRLSLSELALVEKSINYTSLLNQKQVKWRKELFDSKKNLYNYRMNNENVLSEKIILTKKLYLDLLLFNIRFNNFYKKDSEFFRNIILKKINNFIIKNNGIHVK